MNIPALYLNKIRSVYPTLPFDTLDFNQDGMANEVVIVNGELVCRFAKDEWAQKVLQHEARVLELVRQYVDLPVPNFEHLEEGFVCYRFLKGQPLSREVLLRLPREDRIWVLEQLIIFHQQLHTIPRDVLQEENIQPSVAERSREDWLVMYGKVEEILFPLLWQHQRKWVRQHFQPIVSNELNLDYTPNLVHGDLGVYHILYDAEQKYITGILDFGVAGVGDPAIDIGVLLSGYGETLVREMAVFYPELNSHLDRARFRAGVMELEWALMGIKQKDMGILVAHIGGARDIMPVGS